MARYLGVRKHARRGFGIGVGVAIAVYVFFVVIPATGQSPALYVALAFVLAISVGGILTLLFTVGSLYRVSRDS
jgi:lipopolysaccharide export LptBFGC system permease protein LptF